MTSHERKLAGGEHSIICGYESASTGKPHAVQVDTNGKLYQADIELSVTQAYLTTAGTNAVEVISTPCKIRAIACSSSSGHGSGSTSGSLSFYDSESGSTAPTNSSSPIMVVNLDTPNVSLPNTSYVNVTEALWVRANDSLDWTGTTNKTAQVTVWYTS